MKNKETYKISSEKLSKTRFLKIEHPNPLKALVYIAKQRPKKSAVCIDDAHVLQAGFIKIIFESVKFEIQQPFFLRI